MNKNFQSRLRVLVLLTTCCLLLAATPVWAFPTDSSDYSYSATEQANKVGSSINDLVKSLFNSKKQLTTQSDLNLNKLSQFVPKGYGLSFDDLINTKSFSAQDLTGSIKAVVILFIKLVITALSIALGIFKVLLDLIKVA